MEIEPTAKQTLLAKCALFGATLIWGISFFIMKNTVDALAQNFLLAIRFSVGCFLLSCVFYKRLKAINRSYLIEGAALGVILYAAYTFQTFGLFGTTPGKNAFLTAVYCIIVPFLFWAVQRRRPDRYHFFAAVICLTGIALVSLTRELSVQPGDYLTLVGGFFFAAHIVAMARFTRQKDPVLLTIVQFGTAAVICWGAGLAFEPWPAVWQTDTVIGLLYLAVFATTIAILLQAVGQKYADPSAAAIILSLESVFGVFFSVLFYGERLTARLVAGFTLIFVSVLISETKLSFLTRLIRPKREKTEELPEDIGADNRR